MPKLTLNHILFFLIFTSTFALSFAYIAQYYFLLEPCNLCLYQRKPFFLIIIICAFFLIFFKTQKSKKIAIFLSTIFLITNAAIAIYHSGVEKKIFKIAESCTTKQHKDYNSIAELRDALLQESLARCDEPKFLFLNLSMAQWNAIYCLMLFFITILFYRRHNLASNSY